MEFLNPFAELGLLGYDPLGCTSKEFKYYRQVVPEEVDWFKDQAAALDDPEISALLPPGEKIADKLKKMLLLNQYERVRLPLCLCTSTVLACRTKAEGNHQISMESALARAEHKSVINHESLDRRSVQKQRPEVSERTRDHQGNSFDSDQGPQRLTFTGFVKRDHGEID